MTIPNLGQPQGEYTEIKDDGRGHIRLLYCFECKTLEELPDYQGRPEDDHLLELLCERHETAGIRHNGFLSKILIKIWEDQAKKKEIIKNLRNRVGGGLADLDPDYYTTKATFYDDAMKCYSEHLRPKAGCSDWRAKNKRLIPKSTADLRKEIGLAPAAKTASTNVYLCDFCPVKTHYVTQQRKIAGLYE